MTFFDFLKSRHLVDSCTCDDAKMAALLETPQTLYIGFDPTASCLQAGTLSSNAPGTTSSPSSAAPPA